MSDKGNEGQTSYPLKAWTTFPSDNIFPVRISSNMVEPKCGPVTVFDANGDMKKEIFTTIRDYRDTKSLIIGLKSNGEELFNIDGNETTNSGFAYFDRALYSGVAVGPYGTQSAFSQDPQIIAATRNIDSQPNILASYSLQDDGQNRPRPRWQKQEYWYQTHEPGLANLDDNSVSSMEVLLLSDDATLKVLENNGNVRWQRKIPSLADRWPMSKLAVGKQSANGSKMIVVGSNDGVYIISATGIQRKIFSRAGYTFDRSAPIICDLDGDGYKEIIIRGTKQKQVGDITE